MQQLQWGDLYDDLDTGARCKYFCPHEGQAAILNSNARFLAALGGVHSGKTSLACLWLVNEITRLDPQGQYLIVAPTFGVALSSTLEAWLKTVRGTALEGKFVRDNANPHYRLGTRGVVYFKSGDANFEGLKPLAAVLDEGGNVSEDCFHAIKRRLDGHGGRLLISTTPYLNYNWIPIEIIARADSGDSNYFYRCFPTSTNPAADRAAIEEARKTLPPWEFQLFYEGKYSRPPGLVYSFYDSLGDSCLIDMPATGLPKAAAYYGGIDWGGTDPTAALVGLLDQDDCLWIFWEHYKTNQDILSTLETLNKWHNAFEKASKTQVRTWYADHRPDSIRALRKSGLNVKPARKGTESLPLGISLVNARIRTGRLKIIRSQCPGLCNESLLYRYPMADGQVVGYRPKPGNDHAMDALRYICLGIDRKQLKAETAKYLHAKD